MLTGTDSGSGVAEAEGAAELTGTVVLTDGGMTLTVDLGVLHATASITDPATVRTATSPGSCHRRRGLPCSSVLLRTGALPGCGAR